MGNQEDLEFVTDAKIKKETQDKGGKAVISCKFCGKKHVRSREECPAWGKVVASVEETTTLQSSVQSLQSLQGLLRRERRESQFIQFEKVPPLKNIF